MGRIGERFAALRARGERALIPFVTAGDPDLATTQSLVLALAQAGADLIEIGIPFSDPLAEGPTVQRASERALRSGASLRRVLELVKTLRPQIDVPLVLMGYTNPILAMGERAFAEAAREVGVDGVIVVDLPPDEDEELYAALAAVGIDAILLAAPTTLPARLAMLAQRTRGFLYYVSLTGVTGARSELARGVEEAVRGIRAELGGSRLRRLRRLDARARARHRALRRWRRGRQRADRRDPARGARAGRDRGRRALRGGAQGGAARAAFRLSVSHSAFT